MKPKIPRLKKGPELQDYVVQAIERSATQERVTYKYWFTRKEARDNAKAQHGSGVRVRVFRIKYELEIDLK